MRRIADAKHVVIGVILGQKRDEIQQLDAIDTTDAGFLRPVHLAFLKKVASQASLVSSIPTYKHAEEGLARGSPAFKGCTMKTWHRSAVLHWLGSMSRTPTLCVTQRVNQSAVLTLLILLTALASLGGDAHAQARRDESNNAVVTILTDAMSGGDQRGAEAISQLSRYFTARRMMRVLPVAGQGGGENLRDLIYLGGIDLAIVSSDVLAIPETARKFPDARRRLRLAMPLFEQRVYVLAKSTITRLQDLAGKRVLAFGRENGGHATARAILALEGVNAILDGRAPELKVGTAELAAYDAIVLLEGDLGRLAAVGPGFKLLPLPLTPALAGTYNAATIAAGELPGFAAGPVETIEVSTVLAVYNVAPASRRYKAVEWFLASIYTTLAELRQEPGSIWKSSNPLAVIPGWRPHEAARPERFLLAEQMNALSVIERLPALAAAEDPKPVQVPAGPVAAITAPPTPSPAPAAAAQEPAAPAGAPGVTPAPSGSQPGQAPATARAAAPAAIRIAASPREPLANPASPSGGLVIELIKRAMAGASTDRDAKAGAAIAWSTSPAGTVQSLLEQKAVDLSLPWETIDCDQPNDLSRASVVLCDQAIFTEPLIQVVLGLYTLSTTVAGPDGRSLAGKSACLTSDRDTAIATRAGQNWLRDQRITIVRRESLLDCAVAVQTGEVEAFIANDIEAGYLLQKLGLSSVFRIQDLDFGTRGIHAAVWRDNPRAQEIVALVNSGIQNLKRTDDYSAIMRGHLMAQWADRPAKAAPR